MKKVMIVYWSGSGNTRMMAEAIAEGAGSADSEVTMLDVADTCVDQILEAEAIALGCPSMGCEVLEESMMEPFVTSLEQHNLAGKPMVLFGSYDWGDGQWMRDWDARMKNTGATLFTEGLILQNTPDAAGLDMCRDLGIRLAGV